MSGKVKDNKYELLKCIEYKSDPNNGLVIDGQRQIVNTNEDKEKCSINISVLCQKEKTDAVILSEDDDDHEICSIQTVTKDDFKQQLLK